MAETELTPGRPERLFLAAALAAGALFRVVPYVERPSLSLDEARLTLAIASRSFVGLLRPLDYDQAAPPLFLWLEKVALLAGGPSEYALRALPLLAGLLVPVLTCALARRLAGGRVAVIACALAALSPSLANFSLQVKPYQTDVLACVGLLTLYVAESERGPGPGPGLLTLLLGAIAVWLSAPAPFVLATIAAAGWLGSRRRLTPALAMALGAWGVSFAVAYFTVYRTAAANPYLRWFWRDRFLDPLVPGLFWRAYDSLRDLIFTSFVAGVLEVGSPRLGDLAALAVTLVIGVIAVVGMRRLVRPGPLALVLLCGPGLLATGASVVGQYPVGTRLILFTVPSLMILVAAGIVEIRALPRRGPKVAMAVLLGAILVAGALRNVVNVGDPTRDRDTRSAVAYFERRARPGEPVYVMPGALPAWTFYTTDWRRPDTARLARMAREGSSGGPAFENAPSRGRAVRDDGADLAFPFRGGTELLGIPDGAPVWEGNPWKAPPDPGWAESEARRIERAARPTVWVIATTAFKTDRILDGAIRDRGGVLIDSLPRPWVLALRYRFPSEDSGSTR